MVLADTIFDKGIISCRVVAMVSTEWIWVPIAGSFPLAEMEYFMTAIMAVALHNFFIRSLTTNTTAATVIQICTPNSPANTYDGQKALTEDSTHYYIF